MFMNHLSQTFFQIGVFMDLKAVAIALFLVSLQSLQKQTIKKKKKKL